MLIETVKRIMVMIAGVDHACIEQGVNLIFAIQSNLRTTVCDFSSHFFRLELFAQQIIENSLWQMIASLPCIYKWKWNNIGIDAYIMSIETTNQHYNDVKVNTIFSLSIGIDQLNKISIKFIRTFIIVSPWSAIQLVLPE